MGRGLEYVWSWSILYHFDLFLLVHLHHCTFVILLSSPPLPSLGGRPSLSGPGFPAGLGKDSREATLQAGRIRPCLHTSSMRMAPATKGTLILQYKSTLTLNTKTNTNPHSPCSVMTFIVHDPSAQPVGVIPAQFRY